MNWFKQFWQRLITPAPVSRPAAAPVVGPDNGTDDPVVAGNFSPRTQQVLALARREADRFHHDFVSTEHLLLGLIVLDQGVAVTVLKKLGLDLEAVRREVEQQVGTGPEKPSYPNMPYTPRVKRVLALADKERRSLGHTYVGTEHLFLGLLREGDGVAARVLKHFEVDIAEVRREILRELSPKFGPAAPPPPKVTPAAKPADLESRTVDTSKRYDIYCSEPVQSVTVYRGARFKGLTKLFPGIKYDVTGAFYEIEQADGSTVFVSQFSVLKFCEPGTVPKSEKTSPPA